MKKYVTASFVTVALALGASACGGDDDKSGGESDAERVTASLIASAAKEGVEIDGDCVGDTVGGLSEADLAILVENLAALESDEVAVEDVGLSEEGLATMTAIVDCVEAG